MRSVLPAPEVPFADKAGPVTTHLQAFGEGSFLQGQLLIDEGRFEPPVRPHRLITVDVFGDVDPHRVAARHEAGPAGAAQGRGGVGVGEPDAAGGQAVEVGRFDEVVAVAA